MFECKLPSVSQPNKALISHLVKKFCKEGTVKNLPHQWRRHIFTPTKMSEIKMKVFMTLQTSIRKVSAEMKTSHLSTQWATKLLKLIPRRVCGSRTKTIRLSENEEFCQLFLTNYAHNKAQFDSFFFSDEAWFMHNGYVNS